MNTELDRLSAIRAETLTRMGGATAWFLQACSDAVASYGFLPDQEALRNTLDKARRGECHSWSPDLYFSKDGLKVKVHVSKQYFLIYGTIFNDPENKYNYTRIGESGTFDDFVRKANKAIKKANNARARAAKPS